MAKHHPQFSKAPMAYPNCKVRSGRSNVETRDVNDCFARTYGTVALCDSNLIVNTMFKWRRENENHHNNPSSASDPEHRESCKRISGNRGKSDEIRESSTLRRQLYCWGSWGLLFGCGRQEIAARASSNKAIQDYRNYKVSMSMQ